MTEAIISLIDPQSVITLFGTRDQHLRKLSDAFRVNITHRDGAVHIAGQPPAVTQATAALEQLKTMVERRGNVDENEVARVIAEHKGEEERQMKEVTPLRIAAAGRSIRPKTPGQATYIDAIRNHDLVFAVGPAGTGKTYLAVAAAVESLLNDEIRKIVLVRPAVEAGESLGYLPGDMQAKINPYLRPLLDALYAMIDYDQVKQHMERDTIEVVPLAYMRGRTLNDAFIILDEAQNSTVPQMKMFLTRMGQGSKIVVAGDKTQNDLPPHTRSGLSDALSRLKDIDGFAEVHLNHTDIVRHRLVQEIVQAYEERRKRR